MVQQLFKRGPVARDEITQISAVDTEPVEERRDPVQPNSDRGDVNTLGVSLLKDQLVPGQAGSRRYSC